MENDKNIDCTSSKEEEKNDDIKNEDSNADKNKNGKKIKYVNIFSLLLCAVCLSQLICSSIGIDLPINIVIDALSIVIAVFIYFGFIDYDKSTDSIDSIKEQIATDLLNKVPSKNKNKKDTNFDEE